MNGITLGATKRLVLLSGLSFLAACTATRTIPIAPVPLPDPLRVEIEEETVELHHPRLEEGEVVGWQRHSRTDSTLVRVPYEREVVELDQRRSLIVGFGALAAVIALLALL
jgi:hypothetical protein